jgi:hypothetical protein
MFKMYKWVHLEKTLRMIYIYIIWKTIKMIIMVKVGYFCMKQIMMWDNGVIFPFH